MPKPDAPWLLPLPPSLRMGGERDAGDLLATSASIIRAQARYADDPDHARLLQEFADDCQRHAD